jgi:hypothetical protein
MIRKVYEVDPMACPHCGGIMKVIAFLTDYAVVDRIIDHLKGPNIFRDFFLPCEVRSAEFQVLLASRPFPSPQSCSPKPTLTASDVLIYAHS